MSVRVMVPVEFVDMPLNPNAAIDVLNLAHGEAYSVEDLDERMELAEERAGESESGPTASELAEAREWVEGVRAIFNERGWGESDPHNFFINT